mgnify:CR=1 FL=1|jgi:hypothetical protein
MDPQAVRSSVAKTLRGLRQFEVVLALILIFFPVALRLEDSTRESISKYHDLNDPRWYFMPLTAATMMFVVNGLVRREHGHNVVLGVLLFGVVFWDPVGVSRGLHTFSAAAFYLVAFSVIALQLSAYLTKEEDRSKIGRQWLVTLATLVLLGAVMLSVKVASNTFWMETIGLWLIALHYIWHSGRHARGLDDEEPSVVLPRLFGRG